MIDWARSRLSLSAWMIQTASSSETPAPKGYGAMCRANDEDVEGWREANK